MSPAPPVPPPARVSLTYDATVDKARGYAVGALEQLDLYQVTDGACLLSGSQVTGYRLTPSDPSEFPVATSH
jgi:hypothetical protein